MFLKYYQLISKQFKIHFSPILSQFIFVLSIYKNYFVNFRQISEFQSVRIIELKLTKSIVYP